jgi:hypothetical protein
MTPLAVTGLRSRSSRKMRKYTVIWLALDPGLSDPKCLDFHQTDRVVITASKWQVQQKINAASAGRWRNYERFLGPLQRLMNLPTHP